MSKRIRIYTASDVLQHNSESSCWVTHRGKVLDVTNFLMDHPGGEEFILKYAGRDVENAMKDEHEHVHSESAYDMLDEFLIGRLGAGENVVSDDWVATDDFTPDDTDEAADYEKNQFLDLRKPLMRQMWDCNFRHVLFFRTQSDPFIDRSPHAAKRIIFNKFINLGTFPSLLVSLVRHRLRLAFILYCVDVILNCWLGAHEDEVVGGARDLAAHSGIHRPTLSSSIRWRPSGILQSRPIPPFWPHPLSPY
jgi:predicted heme/steroid binding protein